jgi:hypothetical protein
MYGKKIKIKTNHTGVVWMLEGQWVWGFVGAV